MGKKASPVTDPLNLNKLAGGGGGSSDSGSANGPGGPDPQSQIQQQSQANQDAINLSARLNRTGYNTPYGSINYTPNGDGSYTQNSTLTPGGQQNLDLQTQLANIMAGKATDLVNHTTVGGPLPDAPNAASYDGRAAADAVFAKQKMYLDPQFDTAARALDQRLNDQGLAPGSEGWKIQQSQFGDTRNRAYNDASLGAVQAGESEAQRQFGNAQTSFGNQLTLRQEPLQELAGIISGAPNLPNAPQAPVWTAPVVPVNTYQPYQSQLAAQTAQFQAGRQADSANKQGMGQVAVAGAGIAAAFI